MKTFYIYFKDLTPATQKEYVEFIGGELGNGDVFPIASVDIEEDVEEDIEEGRETNRIF